ncbi:IclR family transcriptional regulator [Achromobacter sp. K91]|jgi:DNA-binding IclR family transcriptional regulator|uniref:IclR family transcriptional regulator n=1 Tax=Achromobacter aegrifaciens TaxID=1287736 RepID=A0ABU2DFR1_ACHAE|nr:MULTISPECIES: IclR family transcriptional regulator [Achromobacter]MBD9382664.1 IclR family transcriptional regulator [Achromobacter sp. ACM02]MBD9430509.1 IclR family transcriptional regulator [Achromobacter sp. ACM03]MBD9472042.1 IclR family transcriptional regulator [Achromobacter sp. ACM01]MDR7946954.1 IclR family transcriptional regulator [Achromobacter aegrifaciens]RIJ03188.1 IclR family transcriptional regulator [Achromobacter sp. K91]
MSQDSKLPPLERYTRILELLASFPDGLALTEIARMLALPKTSAHRLLGTMQDSQLVDLAASTYVLGARVKRLAYASADTEWIGAVVRPHLADLAAETDETCYLAKLHSGHQVSSVLMEAPDTPWRGFVLPGKGMAPHAAASAKAILAFQAPKVIDAALAEPLPRLTAHTCVDSRRIRDEYAQVRQQGYATCIGEIDEGLAALGVPVHLPHLGVIYSLGVTGPLQRLKSKNLEALAAIMQRYAERVAHALAAGYTRRPADEG